MIAWLYRIYNTTGPTLVFPLYMYVHVYSAYEIGLHKRALLAVELRLGGVSPQWYTRLPLHRRQCIEVEGGQWGWGKQKKKDNNKE